MTASMPLENQLLATKFYVPITSGPLISRPRLSSLLAESLKYPLTLISALRALARPWDSLAGHNRYLQAKPSSPGYLWMRKIMNLDSSGPMSSPH